MMCGNDGGELVRKGGRGVVRMCPTRRAEVVVAAGGNGRSDQSPLLGADCFFKIGASAAFQARVSVSRWCGDEDVRLS